MEVYVPTGWRAISPSLMQAEQFADQGVRIAVEKRRAINAIKRVGAHIGLKAADMMLLDTLAGFSQAQDWEQGRRPIVWASNAYLMEQTGFSLSALRRHARRLAEAGTVAFKDSPNGKRWGRRDAQGMIVEAYGFDLSPLAARAEEFEQLHAELQAERAFCQRLKRQITVARRMIRARIEAAASGAFKGPWMQLTRLFEDLLSLLPRRNKSLEQLQWLLARFRELQERVEMAYLEGTQADQPLENATEITSNSSQNLKEMEPREIISGTHTLTTKELISVTCNSAENEDAAGMRYNALPTEQIDTGLNEQDAELPQKPIALELPVVMQACPEFASWAHNLGGYLRNWGDLYRIAGQLRPMIGISERGWNVAQDKLGKQIATVALALVFEKHSAGEVVSPGGYLSGMVKKAGAGELHLERSLFGRLNSIAA